MSAAAACLLVRGDRDPFALVGDWAGGGAIVGSEPVRTAGPGEDPFALLERQPGVGDGAPADAVGGGWFGWLGYGLGGLVERLPPGPPRPAPLPAFALGFYDHLLRRDALGRWWFEALWTEERDAALRARLAELRGRLEAGVREREAGVGELVPAAPGAAGHVAAVEECRERIAAGEIFQANLCMRLEGSLEGEPLDVFSRSVRALEPRYAAFVGGAWGAVCSLSPELFLRRRGRRVVSEPIKGTAPRSDEGRAELAASAKDRAENVMIVDLMRNDLGRVCEYGSVSVPALVEPRPAPGVWHLVSTVSGTLREGVGDGDLLRASFPPGSVTGAPKIQSMRVIAELEATGREAYTGAIGYASPVAGLELNVAIRTLEMRGDRVWLGVGGGIVADSEPSRELRECFVKARPVVEAAGGALADFAAGAAAEGGAAPAPGGAAPTAGGPTPAGGDGDRAPGDGGSAPARSRFARLPRALAGDADRPDPGLGVFSTLPARGGVPVDGAAHLARLAASVAELYGQALPGDVEPRLYALAGAFPAGRLRVLAAPGGGDVAEVEVEVEPLRRAPAEPLVLAPMALPGGIGPHKWRDRRLLEALARRTGAVPLIVDLDGDVLEAAHANVWIVEDAEVVTPPLDGRQLPGVVRARLLELAPEAHEERIRLDRLAVADEVFLTSSTRGPHPAALPGAAGRFEVGRRLAAMVAAPVPTSRVSS
ncbi:MAG TPA: aminodeoxychorismate synthase component I [Thermoleophilaceae bacterium]